MAECQGKGIPVMPFIWSLLALFLIANVQHTTVVAGTTESSSVPSINRSENRTQDLIEEFPKENQKNEDALSASVTLTSSPGWLHDWDHTSGGNRPEIDSRNTSTNNTKSPRSSIQSQSIFNFFFITRGIISPIIVFPGIVCNVINIYVLWKQGPTQSTIRYLIGLSIFDLLYLVSVVWQWSQLILETFYKEQYLALMLAIHSPWNSRLVNIAMGRTSNLLIVVISVERFVAVKFPFAAKSSPLTRHAAKVVISVAIFVTALLVPNALVYDYVMAKDELSDEPFALYHRTDFAVRNKQFYINYTTAILVILRILPVASVLILNTGIIISLKTGETLDVSKQTTDDKRQTRQLKITRMLVAVASMFLLCVTPSSIHSLFSNFLAEYKPTGADRSIWVVVYQCGRILDDINSAGNFVIYILMSERFRVIFLTTFCYKWQGKNRAKDRERP